MDVKNIRNVVFVSHSGAGKTSLIETLLFNAGATSRLGSIAEGTTVGDYNADEIERKITIGAKFMQANWREHKLHLIDTPGYADFIGEVISSFRAADCAVVVVCAVNGIEVGTERVWNLLDKKNLPRLIFINRLDKENSDFNKVVNAIKNRFGKKCIPIQYPQGKEASFKGSIDLLNKEEVNKLQDADKQEALKLRESCVESIAETDDKLIEKYLEGQELSADEIKAALRRAVISEKIIPVICGSATANLSIKPLLDLIVEYLPSPQDRPPIEGKSPTDNSQITRKADIKEPFSAFVFKSITDPYVGQLTVFRIFSGSLSSDAIFYNSTKSIKERIGQIYSLQGKEQKPINSAQAGDIVAVAKLKDTSTNDSLCDEKAQIIFEQIVFPQPAISFSVKPKSRGDEEKIMGALSKLSSEDPTFKFGRDSQTKELIISGLGDLHLEVIIDRMRKKFGVQVEIGTPKVAYKETITKTAKVQGKYKRQSGGRGQYGDVWLEIEPLPRGSNFEFADKIFGGAVPKNYIPAVEKGVQGAMAEGVLAGYPIVDIKVTIYDGSFHPVDSSDMAFQISGSMALKKGCLEANPVLIEPIMEVEAYVPDEYMGSITGDLNSRRGRILGIEPGTGSQTVKAQVPLAEMLKYATELRSITGGRGSYSMKFSHYDIVPARIAQTIIAQANVGKQEEE